jgi:hypothetical protein
MKIREVAHLLKNINSNPTKLQKIKKNLLVNLQPEIDNECLIVDDSGNVRRTFSNPNLSTGIINGRPKDNYNRFI